MVANRGDIILVLLDGDQNWVYDSGSYLTEINQYQRYGRQYCEVVCSAIGEDTWHAFS